jgi:hypothetical protein
MEEELELEKLLLEERLNEDEELEKLIEEEIRMWECNLLKEVVDKR